MDNQNQRAVGLAPPLPVKSALAVNGALPVEGALPVKPGQVVEGPLTKNNSPNVQSHPLTKTGRPITEWFTMAGVILVESASGFGTGFTLARNNVAGVTLAIIAMSIVYGLEFWIRYSGGNSLPVLLGGFVALIAAGLIPYLSMTRAPKSKGKAASVYLPTIAASWSAVALLFGLLCAGMSDGKVLKSDAIQGVILSLLYAGASSALGYSAGTPGGAKSGNTTLAMMAWGGLVMFDLAGLARSP